MSLFSSKSISAKLVGPNLVASFPNANPPLIWKFDLDRNHSFTIALQGEGSDWELGLTSPKGEFFPIAHFPAKEDAEEALTKVFKVLMKKRRSRMWGWISWIIGLVVLGAVLFGLYLFLFGGLGNFAGKGLTSTTGAVITPGEPQSADELLQAPH